MTTEHILKVVMSAALILAASVAFSQSKITVTGTVTDDEGIPLAGAVVVEETEAGAAANAAMTDKDGRFTINVSSLQAVLKTEYLGYKSYRSALGGKKAVDIVLYPDRKELDEVVVIGYGEAKRSDLTGSVSTVKVEEVASAPVSSIDQALQGKVAGADIMTSSGDPTASTSIRIRGTRSITASNEPLIVVDDVPDAVQSISDINADDIASVSVLKDASATAIYGARGANGVIIITTKKSAGTGGNSKPWVTLRVDAGFSHLARHLDTMNAEEFAAFRNEVSEYQGNYVLGRISYNKAYSDPASLGNGTNWIDEITRTAPYQKYDLSAGGRDKSVTWRASLGYSDIEGIVKDSGVQKVTSGYRVTREFSKKLTAYLNLNGLFEKQRWNKADIGGTNVWTGATYLNPILDRDAIVNDLYETGYVFNNPLYSIRLKENFREAFSLNASMSLEYKPIKELTLKSTTAFYNWQGHTYRWFSSELPTKADGDGSDIRREEKDTRQFSANFTATYKKSFDGGHNVDAMIGYSTFWKRVNDMELVATGMLVDETKWNNLSGIIDPLNYKPTSYTQKLTRQSFMSRIGYNYKKRYYLTFTGRADGSSNFAANRKWGFFPSGAFKWSISNERFFWRAKKIDDLSVRLSAGRTGNDAIAQYRSLEALSSSTYGYLFNGVQSVYYYPSRLESPDLTWEKTDMYNLGVDFSAFKERIKLTAEAYLSFTSDLLLSVQKANQSGYSSFYENIGKTSNRGLELTLETRNIQTKKFGWTTNFTISHNRQRVEDIGSEDFVSALNSPGNGSYMMYGYVKGKPLNSLWGFEYGGVWHSQEEIQRNETTRQYAVPSASRPGTPRYIDQNHDGILDASDLVYLGNADPKVYGGLGNTFNIRNVTIRAFLSYSIGGALYNYSEFRMAGSYTTNQYRYMMNAWHPVKNPDSDLPAAGSVEVHVPSNLQVHDASYLRLKSLGVTWKIPVRKKWMYAVELSATGENLWLLTSYNGFDPDVSTQSSSSTLRRVDMGAYPRARTIVFNVTLRY